MVVVEEGARGASLRGFAALALLCVFCLFPFFCLGFLVWVCGIDEGRGVDDEMNAMTMVVMKNNDLDRDGSCGGSCGGSSDGSCDGSGDE